MSFTTEPISENEKCSRCGRKTRILSNGLCSRCDNVLYGHHAESRYTWNPKPIPIYPDYPPRRKKLWC